MNDDVKLNDEQLRLATTRSLPEPSTLDADTASAREGFLAFGAAVESAAGDFDEASLVAGCLRFAQQNTASPLKQQTTRDWWPLIVTGALAAGMLLAIARIAVEARRNNDILPVAVAPHDSPPIAQTTRPIIRAAIAWNDPLDDEIALAAATIDQFSTGARNFDGSLLDMNDRLEALSRELLGETL